MIPTKMMTPARILGSISRSRSSRSKSSMRREDLMLIKGEFYNIEDIEAAKFTDEMLQKMLQIETT